MAAKKGGTSPGASRVELLESALILVALFSLLPLLFGFQPLWYKLWLGAVLLTMGWVAWRRLGRTKAALEEERRKREERGGGRPPSSN
jgi:hypothetical protein